MTLNLRDYSADIIRAKQQLRRRNPNYATTFKAFSAALKDEINNIKALKDQGAPVIPEVDFDKLRQQGFSAAEQALIQQRGCVIIRGTFPQAQAEDWNQQIDTYINAVGYYQRPDPGLDHYFSSLQSGKPQIFSLYWSKPQVAARQHENLAILRRLLNRLWIYKRGAKTIFDPDRECTYADRIRRRQSGDHSLGLKPHIDGGSIERWLESFAYWPIYRHLWDGDWERYDPFDARFRTGVNPIASPAVCSMFRSFQGWTALSTQGPGDGTLQLIPSARVLGWMLLRALQDDVPNDALCGAAPGRALPCDAHWHALVLEGLCTIPAMQPGDSIWWHADLVHAVEDEHRGQDYSNVMYIGAAPYCQKNADFLIKQASCFIRGDSSPDFAPENYERDHSGRARVDDLTQLGKQQMGLEKW